MGAVAEPQSSYPALAQLIKDSLFVKDLVAMHPVRPVVGKTLAKLTDTPVDQAVRTNCPAYDARQSDPWDPAASGLRFDACQYLLLDCVTQRTDFTVSLCNSFSANDLRVLFPLDESEVDFMSDFPQSSTTSPQCNSLSAAQTARVNAVFGTAALPAATLARVLVDGNAPLPESLFANAIVLVMGDVLVGDNLRVPSLAGWSAYTGIPFDRPLSFVRIDHGATVSVGERFHKVSAASSAVKGEPKA
eukprot:Selendium_serpulae@DN5240_c1_g1_i1.p1